MRWSTCLTYRRTALCALIVLLTSCASQRRGQVALREAELDFSTGAIQGALLWNGAQLSAQESYQLYAYEPNLLNFSLYASSYSVPNVVPGAHTLELYGSGCVDPTNKLGQTSFTVTANTTITADLDLTATAGKVTGSISANGTPLSNAWISVDSPCSPSFQADADGRFDRLLPPGTYTARVRDSGSTTQLGTFAFAINASQTTDLGTVNLDGGTLQGTALWNGVKVSVAEAYQLYAYEPDALNFSLYDGNYTATNLAPGPHRIELYSSGCIDPTNKLGGTDFTADAGATVVADIDLSATAGKVTGAITVNGSPFASAWISVNSPCSPSFQADTSGLFDRLLMPGTYTAAVHDAAGASQLGTFSFTVTAGEATDLGPINLQAGALQGILLWNTKDLSAQEAYQLYAYEPSSLGFSIYDSSYAVASVAPGAHALELYSSGCIDPTNKLGQTSFTVAVNATAVASVDLASTAGKVIGSITVNGTPLANGRISVDSPCSPTFQTDAKGIFDRLLAPVPAPATYKATVRDSSAQAVIGTFTFALIAGQDTDVDLGTTLAGQNISVDLSGGIASIGGISLDFSLVLTSGTTTVVESGAGPPPPTGFRIVGLSGQPRYWDINTTATYSGPITVCIHYDPAQTQGNEANLKLVHDDGSGWQNVTTSIDTTANIICGTATSLSPFAVVEPLVVDSDGDKVPDSTDRCPATQAGSVVDASGCSIADLVPCAGPWKNHGAYVKALTAKAQTFLGQGLIDAATKDFLVSQAGSSKCGT